MAASFYICRQAGITPVQHLCVSLFPPRDDMSYWLELREIQEYATKWFKETTEDGLVRIYTDLGGFKFYLASHGLSRGGQLETTGPQCFCALVHIYDDKNSLWRETLAKDGGGGFILRKEQDTTPGFVLTGFCFPSVLQGGMPYRWSPLPGSNVVVEDQSLLSGGNQHSIWHFVVVEDQSIVRGVKRLKT